MTGTKTRALLIAPTILLSASLAACGLGSSGASDASSSPAVEKDSSLSDQVPSEFKDSGVIRVATDPTYPPFESIAADGSTIEGLDADLAHAIGDTLGLEVEFVQTSFDAIIPALKADKADMALSSIGDTKEREAVLDFATYYWNGTMLLAPAGNPKGLKADLVCDATVGVIRGSLQQSTFLPSQVPLCEKAGLSAPKVQAYQTGPQAQLALKGGRIDAVMQDGPPTADAAKKAPSVFEAVGPLVRNPNPGGIAFPKGSELVEPVRQALNALIEDGTYAEILKKWELDTISIDSSELNGATS